MSLPDPQSPERARVSIAARSERRRQSASASAAAAQSRLDDSVASVEPAPRGPVPWLQDLADAAASNKV
jgi:hypothetical protein